MENEIQKPKVGVGVMIFKDGKILLGKRRWRHGDGEYALVGGSLEYMQSFEDCAKIEAMEEAGVQIKNIKFLCVYNETTYPPRHGIMLGLTAEWESGEPRSLPEERITDWAWYDLDNLPKPIFLPADVMIQSYKTGKNYYDKE